MSIAWQKTGATIYNYHSPGGSMVGALSKT